MLLWFMGSEKATIDQENRCLLISCWRARVTRVQENLPFVSSFTS